MSKVNMGITKGIKSSELLRGFAITTFWSVLSKVLIVLTTLFCSNVLTQDEFGEFSFIRNTLNTILLICATNFSGLAVKFAAESMHSRDSLKKLYILFLFTVVISFLIGLSILAAPVVFIQAVIGGNEIVTYFMKITGLFLPVFMLQPLLSAVLRGVKQFKIVGEYELMLSVVYLAIIVLGAYWGGSNGAIYALLMYYLLFSVVGVYVLFCYNKGVHHLKRVGELASQKKCLKKMIVPVFLMSFIEAPLLWLTQAEIAKRGSYALVGGLSVILTIRYVIQVLPTYFYQAFTPIVTLLNMKGRYVEYFDKFRKVSVTLALIFFVFLFCLVLLGKMILGLFNETYVDFYPSYIISLFVLPLILYSVLYKLHMMIREYQSTMLIMTLISSMVFIFSFYLFICFSVDLLFSFFYSQGIQYLVQLFFSLFVYLKDKSCLNIRN